MTREPTSRRGVAAAARRAAELDPGPMPDRVAEPEAYREWLFRKFAEVETTPAKMAARLDRIDRDNLEEGRPREWSDEYRAGKGLAAFDPVGPRFGAQVRIRDGEVQGRRWDDKAGRPGAWSGGTFSDAGAGDCALPGDGPVHPDPDDDGRVTTVAEALQALDALGRAEFSR